MQNQGQSMKPSDQAKMEGLDSLQEFAKLSGRTTNTLINWHTKKPELFNAVLKAAVLKKGQDND